jgi:hypothetical protein
MINLSACRTGELFAEELRNAAGQEGRREHDSVGAREWLSLLLLDSLTPRERQSSASAEDECLHTAPLFPMRCPDGIVHRAVGLIDMVYSAIPHAPRLGYVFCLCGIVMRLV